MSVIIAESGDFSCYDTDIEIIVIAHNIRSILNVGSIFRTCDGFGVATLYLTGYTPYPRITDDTRLPHIVTRIEKQLHKTALGAEHFVSYAYLAEPPLSELSSQGYRILALEQHPKAVELPHYRANTEKIALLLGEERYGIPDDLLKHCDEYIEIPMFGKKESFNVSVSAGIALYHLRVL